VYNLTALNDENNVFISLPISSLMWVTTENFEKALIERTTDRDLNLGNIYV
jgi:hypothetical protein